MYFFSYFYIFEMVICQNYFIVKIEYVDRLMKYKKLSIMKIFLTILLETVPVTRTNSTINSVTFKFMSSCFSRNFEVNIM